MTMSACKNCFRNVDLVELVATIVLILFFATASSAQEGCTAPSGRPGTCINIRNCTALLNILRRPKPLPRADLECLRKSQCGFDGHTPKVCCEKPEEQPTTVVVSAIVRTDESTMSPPITPPSMPNVTNHPNLRLIDNNLCGPLTQQKIFGGHKTGVFDFPWMALIRYDTGTGSEFRCGGSLVAKRYVLTAAHCVTELPSGLILTGVRLGDHDIGQERDCDKDEDGLEVVCTEKYQDFGIERVHPFPDYRKATHRDDIALIRLNNDVNFEPPSVRPICLPIGIASTIRQKKVTVTGWGTTENGTRSQTLLRVLLDQVPNEQCAVVYKRQTQIWHKQMCAGGTRGLDACFGDSGGPLQAPAIYAIDSTRKNVKYVQYGIVSFGLAKCGVEGLPGVYTSVAYYVDWILNTMTD